MDFLFWFIFFFLIHFHGMPSKTTRRMTVSLLATFKVVQCQFLEVRSMSEATNTDSSIVNKLKTWHLGFWKYFFLQQRHVIAICTHYSFLMSVAVALRCQNLSAFSKLKNKEWKPNFHLCEHKYIETLCEQVDLYEKKTESYETGS